MRLEQEQLLYINQHVRRPARKLLAIRSRLKAAGCSDVVLMAAINTAADALLVACEVSHERLEHSRTPIANPYKPTGGQKTRLSLEEQARAKVAAIERGLMDEAKPLNLEPDQIPPVE